MCTDTFIANCGTEIDFITVQIVLNWDIIIMAITNKNCETISFLATYPYLQPKYWMSFFHLAKESWNFKVAVVVSSFCHGAQLLITSWMHNNYQLVIFCFYYPWCGINCWIQMYLHGLHAEINWNTVTNLCSEIMFTFAFTIYRCMMVNRGTSLPNALINANFCKNIGHEFESEAIERN